MGGHDFFPDDREDSGLSSEGEGNNEGEQGQGTSLETTDFPCDILHGFNTLEELKEGLDADLLKDYEGLSGCQDFEVSETKLAAKSHRVTSATLSVTPV